MNRVHFSSAKQDWETPPEVFDPLNEEFDFTLDVCATHKNRKCHNYFGKSIDGLFCGWGGKCWMNPPYGREISKWVLKAWQETQLLERTETELVCCLLPARTDTRWWHEYIWDEKKHRPRYGVEVRFLKGRIKFVGAPHPAPFPSCIVIFRRGGQENRRVAGTTASEPESQR